MKGIPPSIDQLRDLLRPEFPALQDCTSIPGGDLGFLYQLGLGGDGFAIAKVYASSEHLITSKTEFDFLLYMRSNGISVPSPLVLFEGEGYSGFVMSLISSTSFEAESCAKELFKLHEIKGRYFGWDTETSLGGVTFNNNRGESWEDFWWRERILPVVKSIEMKFSPRLLRGLSLIERSLGNWFPDEKPCLLHGDLWRGNVMGGKNGCTFIDPWCYFGHREMDIGMMKMFCGFEEVIPIYIVTSKMDLGYAERLPLSQLFPLLIHWRLFGEHYRQEIEQGFKRIGLV